MALSRNLPQYCIGITDKTARREITAGVPPMARIGFHVKFPPFEVGRRDHLVLHVTPISRNDQRQRLELKCMMPEPHVIWQDVVVVHGELHLVWQ